MTHKSVHIKVPAPMDNHNACVSRLPTRRKLWMSAKKNNPATISLEMPTLGKKCSFPGWNYTTLAITNQSARANLDIKGNSRTAWIGEKLPPIANSIKIS